MTQSFKKSASHGESYHRESSLPHGLFITFEGIEGSGKTTQIQMLEEVLKKKSIPYITTREPGGTKIAEAIRHILLNPDLKEMRPETELLLYCASRAQHTAELILPALAEGKIVLCDRY
ncbi:MAG: dTMP kinase, partial [Candidatus Cloacimonas sp.]|nr:dTMP kinase [Candidatus Cloacimonas sp.]